MKRYGYLLRRFGAVLLAGAAVMVLSTGCGKKSEKEPPSAAEIAAVFADSFTAAADMTVGLSEEESDTLALSAVITRSGDCCSVEVTAPEHLEGLRFAIDSLENGKLTVSYKGLEIQPDSMPGSNLGTTLCGVLTALAAPEELTVTEAAEGWCVTGQTAAGGFAMLLDDKTHYPLSLTLPDARVGCTFTSFETMSVFRPDRVEEDFAPQESSEDSTDGSSSAPSSSAPSSAPSSSESSPEGSSASDTDAITYPINPSRPAESSEPASSSESSESSGTGESSDAEDSDQSSAVSDASGESL